MISFHDMEFFFLLFINIGAAIAVVAAAAAFILRTMKISFSSYFSRLV